jgi:hypothetical protein
MSKIEALFYPADEAGADAAAHAVNYRDDGFHEPIITRRSLQGKAKKHGY